MAHVDPPGARNAQRGAGCGRVQRVAVFGFAAAS
jgi:hypothetical protein